MYEHPEFAHFIAGMEAHFAAWKQRWSGNAELQNAGNAKHQLGSLRDGAELGLGVPGSSGCHPKSVIAELGLGAPGVSSHSSCPFNPLVANAFFRQRGQNSGFFSMKKSLRNGLSDGRVRSQ